MRGILAKELARVLERRGLRHREWAVEWESSALDFLLDKGFSPAMGARPLKRAIDRYLLAPLAATLVEHRFPEGDQFLFVRSDGRAIQVEFVDPDAPPEPAPRLEPEPVAVSSLTNARMMLRAAGLPEERAALMAELQQIGAILADGSWSEIESALVADMASAGFLAPARAVRCALAIRPDRSRQGRCRHGSRPRIAPQSIRGTRWPPFTGPHLAARVAAVSRSARYRGRAQRIAR